MEIRVAHEAASAATDAANWVAGQVRHALRRRGKAALAVSGGTTPAKMFASLVEHELSWRDVEVWQVDERIAPDGADVRNARLLDGFQRAGAGVHLMPVSRPDLDAACRAYAHDLPPAFDVVHLGLGADGHTASWVPGDTVVDSSESVALSVEYEGTRRMTLTAAVVNRARRRLVLATGADKASAVRGWFLRNGELPIAHLHRTGTVVILDAAAASLLPLAK